MTVQAAVRMLAGTVILISVALAHWVSLDWLFLTVFVGLNLVQSAFTNWCPAITIFRWLGFRDAEPPLTSSGKA